MLKTIVNDLPLGITLVLAVEKEKFISHYLETAEPEEGGGRVTEHLLDGQQRLTALWRTLYNNYSDAKYFKNRSKCNQKTQASENGETDQELYGNLKIVS